MSDIKAKLKYLANTFEIIESGDYVSARSQKNIIKRSKLLECRIAGSLFFHLLRLKDLRN